MVGLAKGVIVAPAPPGVMFAPGVIPGALDGKARSEGLTAGTIPGFKALGLSNMSGFVPWAPEVFPVGFVPGLVVVCATRTVATNAAAIVPPQTKLIIFFITFRYLS